MFLLDMGTKIIKITLSPLNYLFELKTVKLTQ